MSLLEGRSQLRQNFSDKYVPELSGFYTFCRQQYSDLKILAFLSQGEWTRNSRFVAPNLRGAIAPSRFGCDESTCFASIRRLKMHSDMQLVILFLLLIQMHMITSEVGREISINSCLAVCQHVYSKSSERIWTKFDVW